jgi:hypothetical protein
MVREAQVQNHYKLSPFSLHSTHNLESRKQKATSKRESTKGARRLRALKGKEYSHQRGTLQFKGKVPIM